MRQRFDRLRASRAADVVAWMAVAPFAVWLGVRLLGLEDGFPLVPLVPLLAFTPYAAIGSLVAIVVAATLRRRGAAVAGTAVTLAFAALVLPRAIGGGGADVDDGVPLRVLSINVEYGQADPAEVAALVDELDPDVLSVQELTERYVPKLRAQLGDRLPRELLMPAPRATGGGLYSELPLRQAPGTSALPGGFALPRALVDPPGADVVEIAAVHTVPPTDWGVRGWDEDLRALPRAGQEASEPLRVLAGDFNSTLDHAELRDLIDSGYTDAADATGGGLIATWAEERSVPPLFAIDHVLADERIAIDDYSVHTVARTDHRAVFAALALPPG